MMIPIFLFIIDALSFATSFLLSVYWYHWQMSPVLAYLSIFILTKIVLYTWFGLYRAVLRFSGLPLATTIIKATTLSSLVCFIFVKSINHLPISSGFFVTDYLMTAFLVGLIRFLPRYLFEAKKNEGTKRLIIYGAGELGEHVARQFLKDQGDYKLVGFIDDQTSKIGKRIHNLPVFGNTSQLSTILAKHKISELIIAIASLPGETARTITHQCRRSGVFCRIVPGLPDLLKKDVSIKNIDISDLLKREPKDLDQIQINRFIQGKTIMITGAGGSIGSEIVRQCLRYGAGKLVLIDHSEFNLYALQEELSAHQKSLRFCLLNILSTRSLESVFREEKPSIVFHAAAYKHVPIVEDNPCEGIINNVQGTINTALLSQKYEVEKFVLISTDKAVRPTSIMGASKRIAELYIQNLNVRSPTEFIAVRFGNVLGSSGSVIPKFIDQINKGGPVTVTHPEVTRYFMLINEAVQLVLQAASIGNGGEIFILNMGKPVKIAEMAEDIIFLSGREPHKDIQIEFTGLRPGEKLYEELLIDAAEKKTQYENITIGRATYMDWNQLNTQVDSLLKQAKEQNKENLQKMVKILVPEFIHADFPNDSTQNVMMLRSTA